MITTRLLRPSLTSRIMASASGFNLLSSTASAPSSASYQQTYTNGANTNTYSSNAPATTSSSSSSEFTLTALNRWSVANKQLPSVDGIRALHVYDFDNTLFKTPLPNSALWQAQSIGVLQGQDIFANGGWWHDPSILAATGAGIETEEPRAWEGWWNEKIVELIRLSMRQPDALTVLLTGRSERNFAEIVKRVVASKELEFDMVGLKPAVSPDNLKFTSTMHFKQVFLNAMMETYKHAEEIRIYEDRPKHTKGFREFLAEYNRRQGVSPTRGPLAADVVQVADQQTTLDPVVEIAQVQTMINGHNDIVAKDGSKKKLSLKKTTFFTSYMLAKQDTEKILAMANIPGGKNDGIIVQGNNVIISPRPPTQHILDKVGGMGAKMIWKVTGIGSWQDKIWAALLAPASPDAQYHVENPKPWVVLAFRKGSKPIDAKHIRQWDPLPDTGFHIETTVGERVVLRIEQEGEEYDNRGQLKRKHADDSDNPRDNSRGYNNSRGGGRGRGRGDRGNRGGGRGRGGRGGRGGFNNYRSLDDVGQSQQGGYNGGGVSYDDSYPPLGPRQGGNGKRGGNSQGGQGRPHGGQASGGQDLQNYY